LRSVAGLIVFEKLTIIWMRSHHWRRCCSFW